MKQKFNDARSFKSMKAFSFLLGGRSDFSATSRPAYAGKRKLINARTPRCCFFFRSKIRNFPKWTDCFRARIPQLARSSTRALTTIFVVNVRIKKNTFKRKSFPSSLSKETLFFLTYLLASLLAFFLSFSSKMRSLQISSCMKRRPRVSSTCSIRVLLFTF